MGMVLPTVKVIRQRKCDNIQGIFGAVRAQPPSRHKAEVWAAGKWSVTEGLLGQPRERELRRQWHPTPVFLPGKSHGWRSLEGCSPWGHWGLDTTERLHFHFSLSCIGEGNGNPLQCSCLENPRDGGAWWAAIYGVAQSRTWLKWLSSSSSSRRAALPKTMNSLLITFFCKLLLCL